jgi:hypothetical protein
LDGEPHLLPDDELTLAEQEEYLALERKLFGLLRPSEAKVQRSFHFDAGPIVVICPDLPSGARGPLADERDLNFTKMQQYGDLDALVELYGHLRSENPTLEVLHRLGSQVESDDLFGHVILIGGVGWNEITRAIQRALGRVPITQTEVDDLKGGDIFHSHTSSGVQAFYPKYELQDERKEVIWDVGYLARLRNPFKVNRTLTICNGIHSRGVLGAVRCLTEPRVREENEKYLADNFPNGEFAILLKVPVVGNKTLPPDLQDPEARLFEWPPNNGEPRLTEASTGASDRLLKTV